MESTLRPFVTAGVGRDSGVSGGDCATRDTRLGAARLIAGGATDGGLDRHLRRDGLLHRALQRHGSEPANPGQRRVGVGPGADPAAVHHQPGHLRTNSGGRRPRRTHRPLSVYLWAGPRHTADRGCITDPTFGTLALLQDAATAFAKGDVSDAFADLSNIVLFPVGVFTQPITQAVQTVLTMIGNHISNLTAGETPGTDNIGLFETTAQYVLNAVFGPPEATLLATGQALDNVIHALKPFDPADLVNALIAAPAIITDGLLNGTQLNGAWPGLLSSTQYVNTPPPNPFNLFPGPIGAVLLLRNFIATLIDVPVPQAPAAANATPNATAPSAPPPANAVPNPTANTVTLNVTPTVTAKTAPNATPNAGNSVLVTGNTPTIKTGPGVTPHATAVNKPGAQLAATGKTATAQLNGSLTKLTNIGQLHQSAKTGRK
jgi:hypothetical protein